MIGKFVLCLLLCGVVLGLSPTNEILLYPNTEDSPSLYLLSFVTSWSLKGGEYLLINMDWFPNPIDPYHCILVNETIDVRCTSLAAPSFDLTFTYDTMLLHNPQLNDQTTIVVQLMSQLPADTEHFLQMALHNVVSNMKKISPSVEIYAIDESGLVYEENLNFGSVIYKPPNNNLLDVSVLNDQSANEPGTLSTLRVEVNISIPVSTSYSTLFFVVQEPFKFSTSSYLRTFESEEYATNKIPLNEPAPIAFFEVKTPNVFYAVFNETFVANRKFIVEITELSNPFVIAESNISIYSANFNSLTPLEALMSLYILNTVTYDLDDLTLGLPYDIPRQGPCTIFKSNDQYFKLTFSMPTDVPAGYAIRIGSSRMTMRYGTAFINFQSLNYTASYEYTNSYIIIKHMGPMYEGSRVEITFKTYKDSTTNFYLDLSIDTQQIIDAYSSSSYMFYGRVDDVAEDRNSIFYNIRDNEMWESERLSIYNPTSYYLRIQIQPYQSRSEYTSAGSYFEIYFPPMVEFQSDFDPNTDCRFSSSANTGVCEVNKTSNFVHIIFRASQSYLTSNPNPFPSNIRTYLNIYNIKFPRTSSNKYPFSAYLRLFNSSAVNPTTYMQSRVVSVVPRRDELLSSMKLSQHNNVGNTGYTYPGFFRFECTDPTKMDYVLQQNEKRMLSIISRYGIRGMGTINNQQPYPCTSNIDVQCFYKLGQNYNYNHVSEWDRVDVFFPGGQQTTTTFHVIIPHTPVTMSDNRYYFLLGVYNELTKDTKYYYRNQYYRRHSGWRSTPYNEQSTMQIDLEGKAGSYRNNVSITVTGNINTGSHNFLVISSAWSLFENGIATYTSATTAMANPTFYTDHLSPLSVLMGEGMYITIIPFTCSSYLSTFTMWVDNLHMPYHYNLPNYYIYLLEPSSNTMASYNVFEMTNANVFYETPLKSLTFTCRDNYLGVLNTICTVTFGTQNPLKADGTITLVFSGMNIATDVCHVYLPDGTEVESSCYSTQDNKNVTISMVDTNDVYHYEADNFTVEVSGVSIDADQISQSMIIYLQDSTGKYVIETGTRILTTTVARPDTIDIHEITYSYNSPLSSNTLSIKFYLPRNIFADERLGFVMGKDLSDVNLEIKRLRIVLTRDDGTEIHNLNELISAEYKVLFTFLDPSLLVASNYTLKIYGIMTPASHENGAFSIIYQRHYDKGYTLTNEETTAFPEFGDRIISEISMDALFNTEGYEQRLTFTIVNQELVVDDQMVWVINFPSYYYEQLFNFNPYCMIDSAPIQCYADPTTPYQLIIKNSPKIVAASTAYSISIHRLTCPRRTYTNDYYPSRYLFIGILETQDSTVYNETSLLYPEQNIQQYIDGILSITDLEVTTMEQPAFSSIYTILYCECNVDITSDSFLYLIFPHAFDNFNNQPLSIVMKVEGSVLATTSVTVIDRTLEIPIPSLITAGKEIELQFPSLPTPKVAGTVAMSEMVAYVTPTDKKSIYAATSTSGNSAPLLTFVMDQQYLSFNNDETIVITAGTYSATTYITPSNGGEFLTNVKVTLSSAGFLFEPSEMLLSLGDKNGTFKIGADSGLLPIQYFYEGVKTEEGNTYYTITKGNNIRVTNVPVKITMPQSIDIPLGGCSEPYIITLPNQPYIDVGIAFNYDNRAYDENTFFPNPHTTNSEVLFTPNISKNTLSFCIDNSLSPATTFTLQFVLIGTNYQSYEFYPTENATINVVASDSQPQPTISLFQYNSQKTFLEVNMSTNIDGNVYYHVLLGKDMDPMDSVQLKVKVKDHQEVLAGMDEFMGRLYTDDRDERIGMLVQAAGMTTVRFSDVLPERYYTICAYLETHYNVVSAFTCESYKTEKWGTVMKAEITFNTALAEENLNKVLCFWTKEVNTEILYMLDLEGNSCHDRAVSNVNFNYTGETFSKENQGTYIYLFTNPYEISDPSPNAFMTAFEDDDRTLTSITRASAIDGFSINYMEGRYVSTRQAIDLVNRTEADVLQVEFDKPEYKNNEIRIQNVKLQKGQGTIYFLLLLFKQIVDNEQESYVNIRLNQDPSPEQMLNCENWQGVQAEGCARAVYSHQDLTVTFPNIDPDSTYLLYYAVASQYPIRPIISHSVFYDTVLTFSFAAHLILPFVMLVLIFMML